MMELHDENLQRDIESGKKIEETSDVKAYRSVFSALQREPEFTLPSDFADRVVQKVSSQKTSLKAEYLWFSLGLLVILSATIAAFAFAGLQLDISFLKAISPYKGVFIFGIVFIICLHIVDKRILKISAKH